jgi:hypothetical protein
MDSNGILNGQKKWEGTELNIYTYNYIYIIYGILWDLYKWAKWDFKVNLMGLYSNRFEWDNCTIYTVMGPYLMGFMGFL